MKPTRLTFNLLLAALCLSPWRLCAEEDVTNRLAVSARIGFNISATFKGRGGGLLTPGGAFRMTPDGAAYNYDDGYVLTDVSGNAGGLTWNWGYDDSASQISGDTILLSRTTSTSASALGDQSMDGSDPFLGAEISYSRQLGARDAFRFGVDVAANFLLLDFDDQSVAGGTSTTTTDAYPYTPGTTPPGATPASPYQGTFGGPGFVIGDIPVSSSTVTVPGGTFVGESSFKGDLWGGRLGPYIEFPLGERVSLYGSGGLALGYVTGDLSWNESVSATGGGASVASGGGTDSDLLLGAYVAAHVSWRFHEDWSLLGGVQYQYLEDYEQSEGGRSVELELDSALFGTLGLMWNF